MFGWAYDFLMRRLAWVPSVCLMIAACTLNPIGPLDFEGAYDERSDRYQSLGELLDRGYEDAYRQFVEPIVGGGE